MKVTLTVVEGPHGGSSFAFGEHDAFLVGRSPEVQFRLPLKDPTLSRVHFLIEVSPPSCRLMDMASTNGGGATGKRAHAADLKHGDRIHAGKTVLAFAVEDDGVTAVGEAPSLTTRVPDPTATRAWPEVPSFPGYRVDRPLGEGGMGVVYLASRESDGSAVALKVIKPAIASSEAIVDRFLREAAILRKLAHPHIVRFH